MYDLHLIDRYFPYIDGGGLAYQHCVLDKAGAMALDLPRFKKIDRLTLNYRHTVGVAEWGVQARIRGLEEGVIHHSLGNLIPDIYHEELNLAVEIDTGTERRQILAQKAAKYNHKNVQVAFVTMGSDQRIDYFDEKINRKIWGAKFNRIGDLVEMIKEQV